MKVEVKVQLHVLSHSYVPSFPFLSQLIFTFPLVCHLPKHSCSFLVYYLLTSVQVIVLFSSVTLYPLSLLFSKDKTKDKTKKKTTHFGPFSFPVRVAHDMRASIACQLWDCTD